MKYLAILCIISIALLNWSCTAMQSDSASEQATAASQEQIDTLLAETEHLIIPDLEKKHPGKVFTIEWKAQGEAVTQISLRCDKPSAEIVVKDYNGLKVEIAKLPKGTSISYIFPDARPALLSNEQIIELHDLCKKNGSFFYLHLGG